VAVLLYAALGYRRVRRVVRPSVLEPLELAGAAAIIGIELVGLIRQGSFSANWLPLAPVGTIRSGGILQLFSGSELIEVGTGLTIAIFSLLGMTHDWTPDENDDSNGDGGQDDGPQDDGDQQ
jgi:multicomponent Na+:H+ antiporter subunit B